MAELSSGQQLRLWWDGTTQPGRRQCVVLRSSGMYQSSTAQSGVWEAVLGPSPDVMNSQLTS